MYLDAFRGTAVFLTSLGVTSFPSHEPSRHGTTETVPGEGGRGGGHHLCHVKSLRHLQNISAAGKGDILSSNSYILVFLVIPFEIQIPVKV